MCSHYIAENASAKLARMGVLLPLDSQAPAGGLHIFPTQRAPIIRRPPERDSGDEAVPDMELVDAHFGLLPGFAKDIKCGVRTYNARSETVASLASFKSPTQPGSWSQAASRKRHCQNCFEEA